MSEDRSVPAPSRAPLTEAQIEEEQTRRFGDTLGRSWANNTAQYYQLKWLVDWRSGTEARPFPAELLEAIALKCVRSSGLGEGIASNSIFLGAFIAGACTVWHEHRAIYVARHGEETA